MTTERLTLPERPPENASETYAALVTIGGAIARASRGQVTELYRGGEMIARIMPPGPSAAQNRDDVRERLIRNMPGFAAALEAAVTETAR